MVPRDTSLKPAIICQINFGRNAVRCITPPDEGIVARWDIHRAPAAQDDKVQSRWPAPLCGEPLAARRFSFLLLCQVAPTFLTKEGIERVFCTAGPTLDHAACLSGSRGSLRVLYFRRFFPSSENWPVWEILAASSNAARASSF